MTEEEISEMVRLKNLARSKKAIKRKREREALLWELELERMAKEKNVKNDSQKNKLMA